MFNFRNSVDPAEQCLAHTQMPTGRGYHYWWPAIGHITGLREQDAQAWALLCRQLAKVASAWAPSDTIDLPCKGREGTCGYCEARPDSRA